MFWCWLSAKKEGGDCEEQSLPTIHQIWAMVVQHHHRKNKNSLWINIIQCNVQYHYYHRKNQPQHEGKLDCAAWKEYWPSLIAPIPWAGAQSLRHRASSSSLEEEKMELRQKIPRIFHHHHSWKKCPIGEYQIKPLQSMCYNLYVVLPWSRNDFNPFVGTLSWISPQLLQQLPSPAPKRASDSFVENVEPIIRDSKWHLPRPHTPVARSKDDQGR